jgi:hypothetical protein
MKTYNAIVTIMLLSACGISKPMLFQESKQAAAIIVTLADKETLKERLVDEGYRSFCKETRIYRKLAKEKLPLPKLVDTVSSSIADYNAYGASFGWSKLSKTDTSKILRLIVQDHPHAIVNLEQSGHLK